MKVLLTGAFGNLGSLVAETLLKGGHHIVAFDVANKTNQKVAKALQQQPNLDIVWGDIRNQQQIENLVLDVDAVVHLAAVITPFSEANPQLAYDVNVRGTEYIINGIKKSDKAPLLIFSSSISIFGPKDKDAPPSTIHDELKETDHYTQHKIQCEKLVQELTSPWTIIRIAAMVDERMRHSNPQQAKLAFGLAADNKLEYIHPQDACTAIINLLDRPAAHNKIHLLGGGKECQITHLQMMQTMMGAFGIQLQASDFGDTVFYAHWLDTSESQRLLEFQHHSIEDFRQVLYHKFRFIRPLVRPLSSVIRLILRWYVKR